MKKSTKLFTAGIIATTLVAPNAAYAMNTQNNSNVDIDIEKRTVLLGDTSNIKISFKEKFNADTITINFLCYDMPLSATLSYNAQTQAYEGEINFNKDPEYLNVWKIENIVINDEQNPKTLNKEDLENLGLNLEEYKITQDYIIEDMDSISTYTQKTAAPVKKLIGNERQDTAVEISKEGWADGANKVILVNGSAIADGITATPLATTYDAPILLINKDTVPTSTLQEIQRLNPSEIIVIGGDAVASENVMDELQNNTEASLRRIAGIDRHDTSLQIAKELDDNHDINKIYISNGYKGEVDALTIAAKAGQDKQPIILSEKENLPEDTLEWLKNENLTDAYFIGGEDVITTNVIHQVADITTLEPGQSVYKNRVYGKDRHETNAKVLQRFYTQEELDAVLVAKSDVLVDALAAGPLAAKLNSPIIINPTNYVSTYHEDNLKAKTAKVVYQVGGGMRDNVINDIAYKLSERNSGGKLVVVDPGHGGTDSGAVNPKDRSQQEKNYTLDTSLAAVQYLRDNDVNVVMTRDTDVTMALPQRTSYANNVGADMVVSIHYNSSNTQGHGVEVFYKNADKNGGTSKTLANNILNSVLEKFNLRNRGLKTRVNDKGQDYYHMIRESKAPSVIVECSFIDNESNQLLVNTKEKRQTMGVQIGKGIEKTVK